MNDLTRKLFGRNVLRPLLIASGLTFSCLTSQAFPQAYQLLRYNENWSDLEGENTLDSLDRLKRISVSKDGEHWISLGGQARERLEVWENFAFGAPPNNDDSFLLQRVAQHIDYHAGPTIRVFLEGISALASNRDLPGGRRAIDVDSIDILNAFVDISIPAGEDAFTLRLGRQQLGFGKQRLLSPLPWANANHRWDGASGIFKKGSLTLHAFSAQYVPVKKYDFNEADSGNELHGIYATSGKGWEAYILRRELKRVSENRNTFGLRFQGKFGDSPLGYEAEAAYQEGDSNRLDIDATMFAGQLKYDFAETPGKPSFWLGFDFASGDKNPSDGKAQTFDQHFPLGHAYFGFIDIVGRKNILSHSQGISFKPTASTTLKLAHHRFERHRGNDAHYNAGGGIVRAGGSGLSRQIGNEIDLTLDYSHSRRLKFLFGASYFNADTFIEQTGASDSIKFFYTQGVFTY